MQLLMFVFSVPNFDFLFSDATMLDARTQNSRQGKL
jgi:hypothetical protein